MKLSLVVKAAGKQEGQTLPINLPQFVVGRDPQCQLRPASPMISKRHCALIQRDGKAYIRDFGSTNGTSVNDQPVKDEVELHDKDHLKIGPLAFEVRITQDAPAAMSTTPRPSTKAVAPKAAPPAAPAKAPAKTPPPAKKPAPAFDKTSVEMPAAGGGGSEDDDIAAMLMSVNDDPFSSVSEGDIPEGSTVMEMFVPPPGAEDPNKPADKTKDSAKAKAAPGNTASAAKSILEQYMKRPRG